jgi:hypothetical protein
MTLRDLLSKFSLDELWYYLSMRHGLQNKPIKARHMHKSYGSALDELLALDLNQGEICGELCCDFCADKTDEGNYTFFGVTLKEAEEIYSISFIPWKDIIDLPVSQTSIDRYGEWLCAAEILWEVTFWGFSAETMASESAKLQRSGAEAESGASEHEPFDLDELNHEINPLDVKATLDWFTNAPDCVKRSVRNCISANVAKDEDDEQLAAAKTLEKLKEKIGDEPKTEDIIWLPVTMARELDLDDTLLLLEALDGTLINSGELSK